MSVMSQKKTRVVCWGDNQYGQCDVPGDLGEVKQIAAGNKHAMVFLEDGSVRCWGYDNWGQCAVPKNLGLDPGLFKLFKKGSKVKAIDAGKDHSLALLENGTVKSWGYDLTIDFLTPYQLPCEVKQISVLERSSMALLADDTVRCWGGSWGIFDMRLGDPDDLSEVKQIAVGMDHAMALFYDGTVRCWGKMLEERKIILKDLKEGCSVEIKPAVYMSDSNEYGQCDIPKDLGKVKQIAAGDCSSMALLVDGTVRTWGHNMVQVPDNLMGVKQIATKGSGTIALLEDGTVRCWGIPILTKILDVPVNLDRVEQVAVGEEFAMALVV